VSVEYFEERAALNSLLEEFIEESCQPFYTGKIGRPGLPRRLLPNDDGWILQKLDSIQNGQSLEPVPTGLVHSGSWATSGAETTESFDTLQDTQAPKYGLHE